jgi:hypothetical protein
MAVAQVHQREIVEVPFSLPDGQILPHPALVISCDDLQNIEPGMFYAVLISTKNHYPEPQLLSASALFRSSYRPNYWDNNRR